MPRAFAQTPKPPGRIDVHHHVFPPEYLKGHRDAVLAAQSPAVADAVLNWTPERSLEQMDVFGVRAAIVSISTQGVAFGDIAKARSLARLCNEYTSQLNRQYPGRFGNFAVLPMPDVDGSLHELAYALDVLKADGVGLFSSYGDRWPGDPQFRPLLEELDRRGALVFVHPTAPSCCSNLMPGVPPALMEFLTDTTRAITSLLVSGSLTRFPNIRFIFPHTGGTISVLAARYDGPALGARKAEVAPNGVAFELRKLHFDVANSVNPSTMSALRNLVPDSQVLFGTDYPFIPFAVTATALDSFGLSASTQNAINYANAARLIPRLA
jgi:predicted TIM-barrel fold metal-dependent hydrolase